MKRRRPASPEKESDSYTEEVLCTSSRILPDLTPLEFAAVTVNDDYDRRLAEFERWQSEMEAKLAAL